jgi:hypothetical protein
MVCGIYGASFTFFNNAHQAQKVCPDSPFFFQLFFAIVAIGIIDIDIETGGSRHEEIDAS